MTSSATQTESTTNAAKPAPEAARRHVRASRLWYGLMLLAVGWGFTLHINGWHFSLPVFFLWLGWLGLLLTLRWVWKAGLALVEVSDEDPFLVTSSRHDELVMEKRLLLRAIKDIEFDRDLGKMTDEDADEIVKRYRARAIEVIKALEGGDEGLVVEERIEQDLRARLSVATRKASQSSTKKTPARGEPTGTKETIKAEKKSAKSKPKTSERDPAESSQEIAAAEDMMREAEADDKELGSME